MDTSSDGQEMDNHNVWIYEKKLYIYKVLFFKLLIINFKLLTNLTLTGWLLKDYKMIT